MNPSPQALSAQNQLHAVPQHLDWPNNLEVRPPCRIILGKARRYLFQMPQCMNDGIISRHHDMRRGEYASQVQYHRSVARLSFTCACSQAKGSREREYKENN